IAVSHVSDFVATHVDVNFGTNGDTPSTHRQRAAADVQAVGGNRITQITHLGLQRGDIDFSCAYSRVQCSDVTYSRIDPHCQVVNVGICCTKCGSRCNVASSKFSTTKRQCICSQPTRYRQASQASDAAH